MRHRGRTRLELAPALALAALVSAGCAAGIDPGDPHLVIAKRPALAAPDQSRMQSGPDGSAMSYYANPTADWSRYSRVMLDPVTSWDGRKPDSVSPEDQIVLCDYMYEVLRRHLAQAFTIVDAPGPDVMRFRVVISDPGAAGEGLRAVSSELPEARLERAMTRLSAGTYAFAGFAESDGEITDSLTGAPLLVWTDQRVGGGSAKAAAEWTWNDARAAIQYWAETLAGRLAQWHQEGGVSG